MSVFAYGDLMSKLKEYAEAKPKIAVNQGECNAKIVKFLMDNEFGLEDHTGIIELLKAKKNAVQ